MAQIMIGEALRRNRADGYEIGFYHSAQVIPTPFLSVRSANRLINTDKLIDIRYASLPRGMTRAEFRKKYELPRKDRFTIVGKLRPMEEKDVKQVLGLWKQQSKKFGIHLKFTEDHVRHQLLPKPEIVMTYVVENEADGKLTDFMSMTFFHQTVLNGKELEHDHKIQSDATMFYYAFTKNNYLDMIKMAMWKTKEELKCDAFCVMEMMEHDTE